MEKKWTLSEEHNIDFSANGENQHPILQLEWSQLGYELATADAAGRVTIINAASMALNETTVMRPATLDREDELNQVLTMYWLNVDRPVGDEGQSWSNYGCLMLTAFSIPPTCMRRKIREDGRTRQPSADLWVPFGTTE
jgi:hypothetical protein